MTEEAWRPARLIPTSGIRGDREREGRATSALLSVLGAVDEFGKAILSKRFGAPSGRVEAYIEVPLKMRDGKEVRPDGLVRVTRGRRTWVALIEVKTGTSELELDQVESYLDAARERGFDAVVTISNQIVPGTGEHPVTVNKTKLKKVELHHISWVALLTEAVMERDHRGVADDDQAWILSELIAYLEHGNSGAMLFEDMGQHWTAVRDRARERTLRTRDERVDDVVMRWDELARSLCLSLGRRLGRDVQQLLPRRDQRDPLGRPTREAKGLTDDGFLECTVRVPDAVADITLRADLREQRVSASLELDAPREGRPRTRINWLVRQLRASAPPTLRVDVWFESRSVTTSAPLAELMEQPDQVLLDDRRVAPRRFRVTLTRDMGMARKGTRSFVGSLELLLSEFYAGVAQDLNGWKPRAPRLAPDAPETDRPAGVSGEQGVATEDLAT